MNPITASGLRLSWKTPRASQAVYARELAIDIKVAK